MTHLLPWLVAVLLFTVIMAGVLRADDTTLYRASLAAFAAGNALDAHSSWGQRELNPFAASADGRYGARGLSLKIGCTGGIVLMQAAIIHFLPPGNARNAARLAFTKFNFAAAGAFGGLAVRNYVVRADR